MDQMNKNKLRAHKNTEFCANLMTACHVMYFRSSMLLVQTHPTMVKQLHTTLTSCCPSHTLLLTHYALSTTGWMVLRWLFILQLACVVIQHFYWWQNVQDQYKIQLAYGLNMLVYSHTLCHVDNSNHSSDYILHIKSLNQAWQVGTPHCLILPLLPTTVDTLRWPFIVPTDYLVLRKLLAKMSCYQQIAVSAICNGPFISFSSCGGT